MSDNVEKESWPLLLLVFAVCEGWARTLSIDTKASSRRCGRSCICVVGKEERSDKKHQTVYGIKSENPEERKREGESGVSGCLWWRISCVTLIGSGNTHLSG